MLSVNVFIKKLMKKTKNTNNFTLISDVLFLRLTCNLTLKCLSVYINIIVKHKYKHYL